jgi:hydroxyethylthiazole kinase
MMGNSLTDGIVERRAWVLENRPLVHHITNFVVMNETANLTICAGALPVMAHAVQEVEEMVGLASALVLNIGTLYPEQVEAMLKAGKKANALGVPVVLDPVGAGATSYRTDTARRILSEVRVAVVRGNAGEVSILAGLKAEVRGVESISAEESMGEVARELAAQLGCVTAVTGPVDYVSDGKRVISVHNGHPLMGRVTGTGCMSTTMAACYCAAGEPYLEGAAAGLTVFGITGELAAERSGDNPGTFHVLLYDCLAGLTPEVIREKAREEEA